MDLFQRWSIANKALYDIVRDSKSSSRTADYFSFASLMVCMLLVDQIDCVIIIMNLSALN